MRRRLKQCIEQKSRSVSTAPAGDEADLDSYAINVVVRAAVVTLHRASDVAQCAPHRVRRCHVAARFRTARCVVDRSMSRRPLMHPTHAMYSRAPHETFQRARTHRSAPQRRARVVRRALRRRRGCEQLDGRNRNRKGNRLFRETQFIDAAAEYQKALKRSTIRSSTTTSASRTRRSSSPGTTAGAARRAGRLRVRRFPAQDRQAGAA